jgi:hydroxymethylbilane synthase
MFPISLHLAGRPVLIVGGGSVAEKRALGLLAVGAVVTLVAPSLTEPLAALAHQARLTVHKRRFARRDVAGMALVFACTDSDEINATVVSAAKSASILCNDARGSELGDFTVPAIHRTGSLTFTVESGASSPTFTKRLRRELENRFGEVYGRAGATLAQMREIVKATIPLERRGAVMERLAAMELDELASMHLGDLENAVEAAGHEVAAAAGGLASFQPISRICATRGSALALAQARAVSARLARDGVASTLLPITSMGDHVTDRPISEVGIGVFVKELEIALRERRADYAVHSCKDLPGKLPDDMCIAAITKRIDARDVFCSERHANFAALPQGARIGTSSPRRRAQLLALRPDLICIELRGNIDTRLRKLSEGVYDAIVLAAAGLERLRTSARHQEFFSVADMVPAVGQGALAIETRIDDPEWIALLDRALTDPASECAVLAERAFLAEVRGGCQAPIGAHAILHSGGELQFRAILLSPNGETSLSDERRISLSDDPALARSQAKRLGAEIALALLNRGGRALLAASDAESAAPLHGKRLLLGRTQEHPSRIASALRAIGASVIEIDGEEPGDFDDDGIDAILFPSSGSVTAVATRTSALFHASAGTVVIAMGPASAQAASEAGFTPHAVSPRPDIGSFVQIVTTTLLEHVR